LVSLLFYRSAKVVDTSQTSSPSQPVLTYDNGNLLAALAPGCAVLFTLEGGEHAARGCPGRRNDY
jgi:hypothetical protein